MWSELIEQSVQNFPRNFASPFVTYRLLRSFSIAEIMKVSRMTIKNISGGGADEGFVHC